MEKVTYGQSIEKGDIVEINTPNKVTIKSISNVKNHKNIAICTDSQKSTIYEQIQTHIKRSVVMDNSLCSYTIYIRDRWNTILLYNSISYNHPNTLLYLL